MNLQTGHFWSEKGLFSSQSDTTEGQENVQAGGQVKKNGFTIFLILVYGLGIHLLNLGVLLLADPQI